VLADLVFTTPVLPNCTGGHFHWSVASFISHTVSTVPIHLCELYFNQFVGTFLTCNCPSTVNTAQWYYFEERPKEFPRFTPSESLSSSFQMRSNILRKSQGLKFLLNYLAKVWMHLTSQKLGFRLYSGFGRWFVSEDYCILYAGLCRRYMIEDY